MTLRELARYIDELEDDKKDWKAVFWDAETNEELEVKEIIFCENKRAELLPKYPNGD
jgi:hypothetical protein